MRPSLEFAKQLFGDRKVVGVEVGVDIGENANDILTNWATLEKLSLVDNIDNIHDRFKAEGDRVTFIYKPSVEASKGFEDESLDFVYIDANHSYQSVKDDLNVWYPKLKVGGVICGHDFSIEDVATHECVAWAATEFFQLHKLALCASVADFWGVKR
jgi:predicted O-methyltransferase YrrM